MEKVILVTVTYNSSKYLAKLVEKVLESTVPVERIIIVDNNSNQENAEAVKKLALDCDKIILLVSKENLGGAGGFETGVRYVMEEDLDCDYVWLMDDDAYPEPDCLRQLLAHKNEPDAACLCPLVRAIQSGKYQFSLHTKLGKYMNRFEYIAGNPEELHPVTRVSLNSFVGPLIKKEVIREVGFPDGSLFIEGDDSEYIHRISRRHSVYLVKAALMHHRDFEIDSGIADIRGIWKRYYSYRNQLFFIRKYAGNWHMRVISDLLLIKNAAGELFNIMKSRQYQGYKLTVAAILSRAIADGLQNKRGKNIDPGEFNKKHHI